MEKIKQYLFKKDNFIIILLTGVLLLVIAWPIDNSVETGKNESDLWDRGEGIITHNTNLKEDEGDYNTEADDRYMVDNEILQEEYVVQKLENRLEEILSSIEGVGKVNVMVKLACGEEKIVEKDIPLERSNIAESDSTGGNRSTNEMNSREETVYSTNARGDKIPYVIKVNSAKVEGVSVVAEGGDEAMVQKNISEVIQALFGIEAHKIKVVKMKQIE